MPDPITASDFAFSGVSLSQLGATPDARSSGSSPTTSAIVALCDAINGPMERFLSSDGHTKIRLWDAYCCPWVMSMRIATLDVSNVMTPCHGSQEVSMTETRYDGTIRPGFGSSGAPEQPRGIEAWKSGDEGSGCEAGVPLICDVPILAMP